MRKFFSFCAMYMLVACFIVQSAKAADVVTIDGIYYILSTTTDDNGNTTYTATVTNSKGGTNSGKNSYTNESYTFSEKVTYDGKEYSVTAIGDFAFFVCTSVTSIDLSNCTGLTSLGSGCFRGSSALTSIKLPSSITEIGERCFYSCSTLTSIDLSNCTGLKTIPNCCFYSCTSLSDVKLPSSITKIASASVFSGCTSLTSIDLSGCTNLDTIGNQCFYQCTALKEVKLPESLTTFLTSANFSGCTNLTSINLADCKGIKFLPGSCFYKCNGLTSLDLREMTNLDSLGDNCFYCCVNLKEIKLPKSVTKSVGDYCFQGVPGNIFFYGESSPAFGTSVFSTYTSDSNTYGSNMKVYAPPYSLKNYAEAGNMSSYTDKLYPFSDLTVGSTGYATLALPFNATIPSLSGDDSDCYTGVYDSNNNLVTLTSASTVDTLAAGTAVIVIASADEYQWLGTQNYNGDVDETIENTIPPVYDNTSTATKVGDLVGVYTSTTLNSSSDGTNYVLQNHSDEGIKFYKVTEQSGDVTVGQFHAYLHLDNVTNASIGFVFADIADSEDTTGIGKASSTVAHESEAVYNLQGIRMNADNLPAGIYIKGGKKFVK